MLGCIPSPKFRVIHRSLIFDTIVLPILEQKRSLLRAIFEALKAKEETQPVKESTKDAIFEQNEVANDETEENREESENISKMISCLEELEEVHMKHNENLLKANQDIKSPIPGVAKVAKMEDKIRAVKEGLKGEKKRVLHLLDEPNAEGNTLMHITTRLNDSESTRQLLEHKANPNVQDAEGNSPLHTVCHQKDIQTATLILKNNGRLLQNKAFQTPAIEEFFFDQCEEDVRELVEAIDQSSYRKEILEKILRKEYVLFRLVEKEKPEILSIILKILTDSDQEEYVSLVRDKRDGNTALHLATLTHKSLESASHLLEAGARLVTNAKFRTPPIEDFFAEKNQDNITRALVDGLVDRVRSNQLDKKQALKLLVPNEKGRKSLFQRAKGSNWGIIANWTNEEGINFSNMLPRLTASELEDMVEIARQGQWEKDKVHALLCEEDKEKNIFLSRLPFETQQEVSFWNQENTNQIAYKMSTEYIEWLIEESKKGNWNGEKLGGAFCQLNSDNALKLASVDEELQKELAVLNKTKTCSSVPLLGSNLQHWLYQEALDGRWEQSMVFRVLSRSEAEGNRVSPVCNLGMYAVNRH